MIKKIIHISDIHFRTYKRHDEYLVVLNQFIDEINELSTEYSSDELRIVIAGDIVHQKITISNELTMLVAWFLKQCAAICPVIIIAGNHDMLADNKDRMDSLTPIIELMSHENIRYYKESECYEDDNVIWAVYSIFNDNLPPDNILTIKKEHPDKTVIGLFHAPIIGSKTSLGYEFVDSGAHPDYFEGCDIVLLGDIHKRQHFTNEFGTVMAFPSSLIQQDFGETITGHGYLIWDIKEKTYITRDLINDYGFYQFKITSLEDLETGSEELTNK
jgi:DNA repair exonuclease SbcCD nuclease subunit